MPEDKCRPLDWDKVHNFVVEKSNAFLQGIGKGDVDWFLTDTNVKLEPLLMSSEKGSIDKPIEQESTVTKKPVSQTLLVTPPSPHLAVSNSNPNTTSKTKPSILPISEEQVHSNTYVDYAPRTNSCSSVPNRRSSVSSVASASSIGSASSAGTSGGGFFSKLKHKLHRNDSQTTSPVITPSSYGLERVHSPQSTRSRSSSVSNAMLDHTRPNPISRTSTGGSLVSPSPIFKPSYQADNGIPPFDLDTRGRKDGPSYDFDLLDPRLEEYVRFYRQPSYSRIDGRKGSLKADSSTRPEGCLVNGQPPNQKPSESAQPANKIGSLFRRMSATASLPLAETASNPLKISMDSTISLMSTASAEVLPQFKDLKEFKRVAFHSLTFLIDPPQQIPSRTPRKGNVEVLPSGVVRVNPLTESDKVAIEKSQKGLGGGLVVGGTGALGLIKKSEESELEEEVSDDETIIGKDRDGEKDTVIDKHAKLLGIDKPMLHHVARPGYTVPVKKMALDLMYTRCCHLREILPIPAIAKQIPKGSMAPLPLLQLRNPTPTMIEIQTFADFIRIAPIICISLDGVQLSLEQFKILLSAMCAKKQMEKLSLRNTPIDLEGWSLLCWFLSRNKVINKLDITQCPPLSVNLLKKKKKKTEKKPEDEAIVRMTSNKENRSDMDWALFTATIIARGGIEELILTGCCITDLSVFEVLMNQAVSLKTYKLGFAYNQISPQQLKVILESWVLSTLSRGLDLGYNDFLSPSFVNVFLELFKSPKFEEMLPKSRLGFLSFNATNLHFNQMFKEVNEKFLMALPNLKYLDMSNNPRLFGAPPLNDLIHKSANGTKASENGEDDTKPNESQEAISVYFCSKLPLFKSLLRLHLENNGLTTFSLKELFETVPYCKNLAYLSVVGNTFDIEAAASLIQGLENSKSLILVDGDFNQLPEVFKERIGLYTMRNMELFLKLQIHPAEKAVAPTVTPDTGGHDESITDKLNILLLQKKENKFDLNSPEVINFVTRVKRDRKNLKTAIEELLHLQWKNELSVDGKEALIKLLFIDSSLERGLKLIDGSLVDKDEAITSSDILHLHLAEDEKNNLKSMALQKVQNSDDEPALSLAPVGTGSLPVSRTQSLTNLTNLNKEEGSVLKLLHIPRLLNGGPDEDEMFEKLSTFSGEEIRRKLLDVNLGELDNVIDYLGKVRDNGHTLKEFFNQSHPDTNSDDSNILDEIRKKIDTLRETVPTNNDSEAAKDAESLADLGVEETPGESKEGTKEEDDILRTYDKLLNKFSR